MGLPTKLMDDVVYVIHEQKLLTFKTKSGGN